MTHRELVLAVLNREPMDRIPFMPETHIERVRRLGEMVRDRGRYPVGDRSVRR